MLWGRWDEILQLAAAVEADADINIDRSTSLHCVNSSAAVYFWRGQSTDLKACADRAERHIEAGVRDVGERYGLMKLKGAWLQLTGNLDAAFGTFNEAANLARSGLPGSRDLSFELIDLARCLGRRGEFKRADEAGRLGARPSCIHTPLMADELSKR